MATKNAKLVETKGELLALTRSFSQQYLNEEYDIVIEKLINKMARKRDVPFLKGKIEVWAGAVIHALGTINFLFDKGTQPYASIGDIFRFFTIKQSTTTQKSKKIRDMFKMGYFDEDFTIPSVLAESPFHQLTVVNDFVISKNMVEELSERLEYLAAWERKAAEIIGVTNFDNDKKYDRFEKRALLEATRERVQSFYDVLKERLVVPFEAKIEEEVFWGDIIFHPLKDIRLWAELDLEWGILVEGGLGGKKVLVPLSEIELDETHPNFELVDVYQYWYGNY